MSTHNPLIHRTSFQVRSYDVDLHKEASIPSLIQMMHEAAMQHVLELKVSAYELGKQGLGWVLSHQQMEVFRLPRLGERINIVTYPTGKEKVFTYRDFKLYDSGENLIAQAATTWLLMDLRTRRLAAYPEAIEKMLEASNSFDKLPRPSRNFPKMERPYHECSFQVRYFDLDFNEHLSNFYYFKWLLEGLPGDFLKNHRLKALNVRFQGESFLDDRLVSQAQRTGEKEFVHRLVREGKELTSGFSSWK